MPTSQNMQTRIYPVSKYALIHPGNANPLSRRILTVPRRYPRWRPWNQSSFLKPFSHADTPSCMWGNWPAWIRTQALRDVLVTGEVSTRNVTRPPAIAVPPGVFKCVGPFAGPSWGPNKSIYSFHERRALLIQQPPAN